MMRHGTPTGQAHFDKRKYLAVADLDRFTLESIQWEYDKLQWKRKFYWEELQFD